MAITAEQVKEALTAYNLTAADFVINCIVTKVNAVEQCMIDAGADECDITLALTYLSVLLVWVSGPTQQESVRSIGGASVSFKYPNDPYKSLTYLIGLYDTTGCTSDLIPDDPSKPVNLFDTVGGC